MPAATTAARVQRDSCTFCFTALLTCIQGTRASREPVKMLSSCLFASTHSLTPAWHAQIVPSMVLHVKQVIVTAWQIRKCAHVHAAAWHCMTPTPVRQSEV